MKRFTFTYFKPASVILVLAALLFQGCRIYHKYSVTPEHAIESGKKIKIVFTDGTKGYYDGLYLINDSMICAFTNKKKLKSIEKRIPAEKTNENLENVSRYNKTGEMKTYDDRSYLIDSLYRQNDSLAGLNKKRQRIEIFIPLSSVLEIQLKNKGASGAATTVLILGGGWTLACIVSFIAYIVVMSNSSGF